mgnify:CR=1 FL=1
MMRVHCDYCGKEGKIGKMYYWRVMVNIFNRPATLLCPECVERVAMIGPGNPLHPEGFDQMRMFFKLIGKGNGKEKEGA